MNFLKRVRFKILHSKAKTSYRIRWSGTGAGLLVFLLCAASFAAEQKDGVTFDFDSPPQTKNRLSDTLRYGVDLSLEFDHQQNFDLDRSTNNEETTLKPSVELAFLYEPAEWVRLFVNLELSREIFFDAEKGKSSLGAVLELKEVYFTFREFVPGTSVQIGRQEFKDELEWFYDEDLDGVRVFYRFGRFGFELSASREQLWRRDLLNKTNRDRINNYFAVGRYAIGKKSGAALYLLARDERGTRPEDLFFVGFQSTGEIVSGVDYWLNGAYVYGEEQTSTRANTIQGFGIDAGVTYVTPLPWEPSLTLGAAFGTGDPNSNDGRDRNFRQTGLQDNNTKFNGVTKFKYYGEVLEPELSNIAILTAGLGVRPTMRSSIDLVYHYYRQHRASNSLRDANIDQKPNGTSKELGQGLDLIIGLRAIGNLKVELVLGAFFPGNAFRDGSNNAYFGAVEFKYSF